MKFRNCKIILNNVTGYVVMCVLVAKLPTQQNGKTHNITRDAVNTNVMTNVESNSNRISN